MIGAAGWGLKILGFLKGKPFLALSIALLIGLLWYREQYHDEQTQALELAADQAQATIEAQELAAERRYQFMQKQTQRLEQRNQELARRNQLAQASLTEIARIYEAADELVAAKLKHIDELNGKHDVLSTPVPADVVRVFEHPGAGHGHSAGVHRSPGPR